MQRRLHTSGAGVMRREADCEKEMAAIPEFDYLVVNDRLNQAVDDVMAIIRAERLRTSRMSPTEPGTGGKGLVTRERIPGPNPQPLNPNPQPLNRKRPRK